MTASSPIFVRGLSRSGGTLMVTILDAHPDVAMSYELYPTLLEPVAEGPDSDLRDLARRIARAPYGAVASKVPRTRGLKTFLARSKRSGIDHRAFARLLERHLDEGLTFDDLKGRMRFIERCCLAKMHKEGKVRWGAKCNNRYDDYLLYWPDACFLNMVRDGRDVLASQANTGSFNKGPEEVAESWVQTHQRFRELLLGRPEVCAREVLYERLARHPEIEVRRIAEFLGLRYLPDMLDFYKGSLTIYQSSHLSMAQISQPVTPKQIGRWRVELNPEQIASFEETAGDMLAELGYKA